MAKVQLDLEESIHLDVKTYQLELEKANKKRYPLKEVYSILVKKGLQSTKA